MEAIIAVGIGTGMTLLYFGWKLGRVLERLDLIRSDTLKLRSLHEKRDRESTPYKSIHATSGDR